MPAPPAEGALLGRAAVPLERELTLEDDQRALDQGQRALCVDPTDLAGIEAPVTAVMVTAPTLLGWVSGFDDVTTP